MRSDNDIYTTENAMQLLVVIAIMFCLLIPQATRAADPNYTAMRINFAAQPNYNAYLLQATEKALIGEAMVAWRKGDVRTTFAKLNEVIEIIPVSIEAHRRLADASRFLTGKTADDSNKSKLGALDNKHRQMADGLIKSILSSGNGESPATAYQVISISEEHMALWYLGYKGDSRSTEDHNGKKLDVFSVKDENGNEKKVYFDATIFFK